MKGYFNSILSVVMAVIMVGCSTTEKFTVYGVPDTKIYSPEGSYLATIGSNNTAKIELTSDAYYAYLLSVAPGTNEYVPFALDYETNTHGGTKAAMAAGYVIEIIGLGATFSGIIGLLAASSNGDSDLQDTFLPLVGIGCLGAIVGSCIGMPSDSRNSQLSYSYQFSYEDKQVTNNDLIINKAGSSVKQPSNKNDDDSIIITPVSPSDNNKKQQQPTQNESQSERWKKLFN